MYRISSLPMLKSPATVCRSFSSSARIFSGHSKWSTIKHDKAKNDALRSKIATKYANMIVLATREGGSADPALNMRLSSTIDAAMKNNVSKKVIENAIKRASGDSAAASGSTTLYEGVAPGGVALVVEALTENKTRTAQQVRAAFMKYSGTLSPTLYMFDKRGWLLLENTTLDDSLFDYAIEVGAEDVVQDSDNEVMIYTSPQDTYKVASTVKSDGKYSIKDLGIEYAPNQDSVITDLDDHKKQTVSKLIATLEDLDDVTDVYTNVQ